MHRSPAAQAIADRLRERRPRVPPALRATLAAGLGLVALYLVLLAYAWSTDRALFRDMLRLYGLTLLAGREPAMFAVYQPPTPVPLGWMVVSAVLDDVGTLLVTLSWVWFLFERLRRVRRLRRWLVALEKAALRHRRWLHRWGLAGLAAFYWLPGLGSGVLAVSVLGVAARIPLRRLVPVLCASAAGVALFWAVALHRTSAALPSDRLDWLPAAIVAAVAAAALAAAWRQHRSAHLLLLEWSAPAPAQAARLEPLGIRGRDGIVEVDGRVLAERLGTPDGEATPERLHAAAELLLLDGMTPAAAAALAGRGVTGLADLGLLEPRLVADALAEAGVAVQDARDAPAGPQGPVAARVAGREAVGREAAEAAREAAETAREAVWVRQAREMTAAAGAAWRPQTRRSNP